MVQLDPVQLNAGAALTLGAWPARVQQCCNPVALAADPHHCCGGIAFS